ncbi:MAG: efflux RND transporter permease subunit [Acidobacteriota bacterium]
MSHGHNDDQSIATTQNAARFFVEHRQVAWVLLVATILWGVFAYYKMPKRKDPVFPARTAVAVCVWPGVSAEKIEALVTRKIEQKIAENPTITKLESIVRTSVTIVYFNIDERISDTSAQFDDVKLRLDSITDLPSGTQPIIFLKDFAETAALMLTVASPPVSGPELELKAAAVRQAIAGLRAGVPGGGGRRAAIVVSFPQSLAAEVVERPGRLMGAFFEATGFGKDVRVQMGRGVIVIDGEFPADDRRILAEVQRFITQRLHASEFHPDVSIPAVVRDPNDALARLAAVAGDKYSYRQLDQFTDLIQKSVQTIPAASKVERSGVLKQRIYLDYSQQRLAAYGVHASALPQLFATRNTHFPGGILEVGSKNITIDASGEFTSEREIGEMVAPRAPGALPAHLRDVVDVSRDYESPASFKNYYSYKGPDQQWRRARAVTVAIQMRQGGQIRDFGGEIDKVLADLTSQLPADLIIARTSDQPKQVSEIIDVFMNSLYEAVVLVVVVALIGFWEWRSALLMALSIPLTLALTAGFMSALGLDLQQISIGSLIIALGLLVDDPVVANDAIKREIANGRSRLVAAWLGPTKIGRAIMFATITNISAYLPLLLLSGDLGRFIYSIPVVLASSLVASRIVSMTFVPMLGYYLLAPQTTQVRAAAGGHTGAAAIYAGAVRWTLRHRWLSLAAAGVVIGVGFASTSKIKSDFFPRDLSYLSYVDVWLPTDAPLSATNALTTQAEHIIERVAAEYGTQHPGEDGKPREVLRSVTSFVGGGSPRFWFSVAPEVQQLNYAQVLVQVNDKHDTNPLLPLLQHAVSEQIAGALVDVRSLEMGKPVGIPVSVRISGSDVPTLRKLAEDAKAVFRAVPLAQGTRDDWGEESFTVKLKVDQERAGDAGVSNLDVAIASASSINGMPLTRMREGDQEIPVVLRLRLEDRALITDVQSLNVTSVSGGGKAMLRQVSDLEYGTETEKLRRRDQFRTITVATFPVPGALPSEVMNAARDGLTRLNASLLPGYKMVIGGAEEEQNKGFGEMSLIMATSVFMIFLALVIQFNHAFKPVIVFLTIPLGVVGALAALAITGTPFGFIAFLGVASLIGVIVSHVIVLFDFIEEKHDEGAPLEDALVDAGIVRLRPVLVTVGATVFALFPLALHGGPFWEPLCYAQIGGLTLATVGTLWLVPVLYAISVLDLKLVTWNRPDSMAMEAGQQRRQ